jgi:hypothetical protein
MWFWSVEMIELDFGMAAPHSAEANLRECEDQSLLKFLAVPGYVYHRLNTTAVRFSGQKVEMLQVLLPCLKASRYCVGSSC